MPKIVTLIPVAAPSVSETTLLLIEFDGKEYISSFVRDITQRKRSEQELRNSLIEVEQLKDRLQVEVEYLQQEIKLIHNFEEIISENDKFKEIKEKHGPDAIAGVSCARSLNEDSYQMQKLFRAAIGTNNIDHCART